MPELSIPEPTSAERGYAALIYIVLREAPSVADAVDSIAKALAAHRTRTAEVVAIGVTP